MGWTYRRFASRLRITPKRSKWCGISQGWRNNGMQRTRNHHHCYLHRSVRAADAGRYTPRAASTGIISQAWGRKGMTLKRMDNVLIVVDDLEAAKAFFVELGLELEGQTSVEGRWVDLVVGLENVRSEIAMMRTPDGHGRVELTKFHRPAAVRIGPKNAPVNKLGIRRIMFAVDDLDDVLARLHPHGAELVGEVAQYEDMYRLCFIRGPEGIIVALAEQLG